MTSLPITMTSLLHYDVTVTLWRYYAFYYDVTAHYYNFTAHYYDVTVTL